MKVKVATEKPTVNKIIEASIPLFATKGIDAVSVKELAEAAGVNVALISYYFGGKENLYAFVLESQLAVLGDAIEIIRREEISPVMKIRRLADTMVIVHKANPYIDRLLYSEVIKPTKCFDTVVKKAASGLQQFLRDCIREAIAAGQFRSDIDPDFAAISLIRILNLSFISKHLCQGMLPDREDLAEFYVAQSLEIYLKGVIK
ncbi:TetR/AcrR family transcriptional regulator [Sporomusa malonica]|uniref:Transcriptional regulator, TetR family n=1 Tax=Sporomusa malonica TaxID=112901 RepID=A0A1W2C2A0_9FIRM|nr:TetR family transcriptional regulator [Sporomusa malonica]SMC79144.1 transcriptional regulator, TetR family [Sporomusa malonica]